jgi:hypothetical protein
MMPTDCIGNGYAVYWFFAGVSTLIALLVLFTACWYALSYLFSRP